VPPLDGVVVPPVQHLPSVRVRTVTPPLVCVRPGRFQRAPLPIEAQTTLYVPTISDQPLDAASKKHPSLKTPLPPAKPQPHAVDDIADVVTRPEKQHVHSKAISRKASLRRHKPGHTVIQILWLIVLLTAIFFVSALLFPSVNDGILYVLHVDIRAEITYLLDLIQHLF
jgi:hypothetical protein